MSENPLDQSVTRTDPGSEMERLVFRLLIEEKFHPTVVVAHLERNGCDKATARTIVEELCRENPQIGGNEKTAEVVSVLFWILIGAAASFVLYFILMLIILLSGPIPD